MTRSGRLERSGGVTDETDPQVGAAGAARSPFQQLLREVAGLLEGVVKLHTVRAQPEPKSLVLVTRRRSN